MNIYRILLDYFDRIPQKNNNRKQRFFGLRAFENIKISQVCEGVLKITEQMIMASENRH